MADAARAPSPTELRHEQESRVQAQVLGIVLGSPHLWPEVAESCDDSTWTRPHELALWRLLKERAAQSLSLDLLAIGDLLIGSPALEERVGGLAWVSSLPEQALSEQLPYLLGVLRRARQRRRLREVGALIQQSIAGDPEALSDRAARMLAGMDGDRERSWLAAPELLQDTWRRIGERAEELAQGRTAGWPTGWPTVDGLVGGLRAPHMWVIGGRPGVGKSACLLQLLLHQALEGRRVALLSLEMSSHDCACRWLAQRARVDLSAIRDGRLRLAEREHVERAAQEIHGLRLWVDDRPATQGQVRTRLQALARRVGGLDVVGVDYLQLVRRDPSSRYGSRTEEVGAVAQMLQAAAKELGCCVVACAQVGRSAMARQDKRPALTDLRESGDIEAVADVVLMPWRWDYEVAGERPGEGQLLVRKARHGQTGEVETRWSGRHQWTEEK